MPNSWRMNMGKAGEARGEPAFVLLAVVALLRRQEMEILNDNKVEEKELRLGMVMEVQSVQFGFKILKNPNKF